MHLLGIDIGSSSIKASLVDTETNTCSAASFQPRQEMKITAHRSGWAEQEPEMWWKYLKLALNDIFNKTRIEKSDIKAIGISYQMHGLVVVDKRQAVLRPAIIWCDSRAVDIGNHAFHSLGERKCLEHLLNSPGNFTASKLKWIKENEPDIFKKIYKIMLPGDFIAMKMTGRIMTTVSGLSEGIFWDFKHNRIADILLDFYGINRELIPEITPTFAVQGELTSLAAKDLDLAPGTLVSFRAGDQPNNALSLKVIEPGEIAATAGTSGVVYGISDVIRYDPLSRVNSFAHINHTQDSPRLGLLLCVNGTGILYSWLKHNLGDDLEYERMNALAKKIPIGSENLFILPFGNGAERMLENKDLGCRISGLNFNIHNQAHIFRAAQEGIAFSFMYGMDIMKKMGALPSIIKAGNTNLFLSPVFRDSLAGITGAVIELYDTDGAQGAALGAGIGAGIFKSFDDAFPGNKKIQVIDPDPDQSSSYAEAYIHWKAVLERSLMLRNQDPNPVCARAITQKK